ncbi:hypothetical protein [Streptomyces sp. NPDC048111]|uniref:hypothetical protein n=1 Tax=Streptomyces sp. NPDC048111 TaxID=3365500 RepID=UPI003722EF07
MVRRKREKEKRPALGVPNSIALFATPMGWRHSVATVDGGMHCGHLADVPATADPVEACAAAEAMVKGLAYHFHGIRADVIWESPLEPGSWTAEVIAEVDGATTTPHDSCHPCAACASNASAG